MNRKLTGRQVDQIAFTYRHDPHTSMTALAKRYSVSPATIHSVLRGESYGGAGFVDESARGDKLSTNVRRIRCSVADCPESFLSAYGRGRATAIGLGWKVPTSASHSLDRLRCPDHAKPYSMHRTAPMPEPVDREAERRAVDTEYRRRLEARQARERELAEAVWAQHRPARPAIQDRILGRMATADGPYRGFGGFA